MSVGKYSPTVSRAYSKNQKWWDENGGNSDKANHDSWYDNDGFDSYGYNKDGVDRAGYEENDYLSDYDARTDSYPLAQNTYEEWTTNDKGLPIHYSQLVNKSKNKI